MATETDTTSTTTHPVATTTAPVLNTASLIMGSTRSGKSSLLATAAEYIWETYGKVSNYVLVDGGGFPPQIQALVELGIIRLWRARTRSGRNLAFETMQRAAQGWWPVEIDPLTGVTDPNVKLVAPVSVSYTLQCPNGHAALTGPSAVQLTSAVRICSTCKVQVTAQNTGGITQTVTRTPGFEQVGGLLIDGLSSFCSWMMDELTERSGRNELGGEKGAMGTIISGDLAIGGTNRAMYGSVQQRIESMVLSSSAITGLSIPPVWTALPHEMSDEGGLNIIGPMLAGSAKTTVGPQWFGDVMEAAMMEVSGKRYRRLYLQQWFDDRNRRHLVGVRSYPGNLPEYFEEQEAPDGATAFTAFSLANFYRQRDLALTATRNAYKVRFANAPGTAPSTFGGGVGTPAVSPVAGVPAGGMATAAPTAGAVSPAAAAAARARQAKKPVGVAPAAKVEAAPTPPVGDSPTPAVELRETPVADTRAPEHMPGTPEYVAAAQAEAKVLHEDLATATPVEVTPAVETTAPVVPAAPPVPVQAAQAPPAPQAPQAAVPPKLSPAQLAAQRARGMVAPGATQAPGAPKAPGKSPVAMPPGRPPVGS